MNAQTAIQSQHFGYLLPPGKQWFTPKEVAAVIGRTDQFVRNALDSRRILGHSCSARSQPKRQTYHVHRDGLLLFLLETANYAPQDKLERLGEILKRSSPDERHFYLECLGN